MGKYFGTDGIRGIAGDYLTAQLAYLTGFAAALTVGAQKNSGERACAVIGKDTRISSDMLEAALISGLCSGGVNVEPLGVVPTPAIAYLTKKENADFGIVISASHNPYEHNGIKIFNSEGFKLSDELEAEIESLIEEPGKMSPKMGTEVGSLCSGRYSSGRYVEHLQKRIECDFSRLRIAIDCANGAASPTAERIFRKLGEQVRIINSHPNGTNINDGCGSTSLEMLRRTVVRGGFDIGFAFDGDADRCLAVDELGGVVDGDTLLAVIARDMKQCGKLRNNTVVGTIISNSGLDVFARSQGLEVLRAEVGDRNVLELMKKNGANLGGESSGHTIFLDDATTGDGQLTAIKFLNLMARSGKKASELNSDVPKFPQVAVNVPVKWGNKQNIMSSERLLSAVKSEKTHIGPEGSVLVRPSGTEALIRVTVEAKTEILARDCAERLADIVKQL